ncbi:hypothetical protein NKH19_00985 [Mesorhizobium sp. M1338]|uniref:hypothetical protein n=1 Tax=unclassified Mesorhizobium TaxID=325217 RepID=UPI0033397D00
MLLAASPLPGAGESRLHLWGPSVSFVHRSFELVIGDEEIAYTPCASSRFFIPHPSN